MRTARPRPGVGRILGTLLALGAAAGLATGVRYAFAMQPKVLALPRLVRRRLRAHGGTWVPYRRIPPFLVEAVVATEDRSFWTNPGISLEGIARAAWVDLTHGAFVQGGSTIAQQIARDMFLSPQKTIPRKLKGVILALLIAHDFPRREVMALYLNEVYFGAGAYGLAAAAHVYFHRPPQDLTPAQCTLLAGLPNAPSLLDPLRHLARARVRQWAVLASMVQVGDLTLAQAHAIWRQPLWLSLPHPQRILSRPPAAPKVRARPTTA